MTMDEIMYARQFVAAIQKTDPERAQEYLAETNIQFTRYLIETAKSEDIENKAALMLGLNKILQKST